MRTRFMEALIEEKNTETVNGIDVDWRYFDV